MCLGGVSIPTNTDPWIYQRWDWVSRRSKHPLWISHTCYEILHDEANDAIPSEFKLAKTSLIINMKHFRQKHLALDRLFWHTRLIVITTRAVLIYRYVLIFKSLSSTNTQPNDIITLLIRVNS
jgi:hypothetical protein